MSGGLDEEINQSVSQCLVDWTRKSVTAVFAKLCLHHVRRAVQHRCVHIRDWFNVAGPLHDLHLVHLFRRPETCSRFRIFVRKAPTQLRSARGREPLGVGESIALARINRSNRM